MTARNLVNKPQGNERDRENSVSLAPLDVEQALTGLLKITNPKTTKPKRKKNPPPPEKE